MKNLSDHTFLKPTKCTLLIYYTIQFCTVKSVQHVSVPCFGTIIRDPYRELHKLYIYSPTNVQFNHINCVILLSYMFRTLNLGSSSGTHYLKSHTIYTNWYNCLHSRTRILYNCAYTLFKANKR
jgi:hypothetical protein